MSRLLLATIGAGVALAACAALAAPRFADMPGGKAANSVEVDVDGGRHLLLDGHG
jgi:hypothetical protein